MSGKSQTFKKLFKLESQDSSRCICFPQESGGFSTSFYNIKGRSSITKCIQIATQHFQINLHISPSQPPPQPASQANNKFSHSRKANSLTVGKQVQYQPKKVLVLFLPFRDHLVSLKGSVPHLPHPSLLIHRYKHPLPLWCRSDMICQSSQHSEDENASCPVNGRSNTRQAVDVTSLNLGDFVRWAVII